MKNGSKKKKSKRSNWHTYPMVLLLFGLLFSLSQSLLFWRPSTTSSLFQMPHLIPWQSVGGCGAGGSGGGSSGIKWVGEGASGGIINIEILPQFNFGQNFYNLTIPPRISFKPTWNTDVGISLPITSKTAEVQYRSNQTAATYVSGGLGDIGLDFSYSLGSEGQYSLSVSLSLPTGQYDIKRGPSKRFLPNNLQKGSGIYSGGISFSYTKDVENGLFLVDGSLSLPFNMKPISGENSFIEEGEYYAAYKNVKDDKRFYYRFKPYGENDLGDYIPQSISAGFTYAYRGIPDYVHSFGFSFSAPLGVAWIHSENSSLYDPRPDPDHKTWQVLLSYGLEFSKDKYPIFIGIGLPIQDRSQANELDEHDTTPMKKWNQPDWSDMFQQWIFAIGVKSTMF